MTLAVLFLPAHTLAYKGRTHDSLIKRSTTVTYRAATYAASRATTYVATKAKKAAVAGVKNPTIWKIVATAIGALVLEPIIAHHINKPMPASYTQSASNDTNPNNNPQQGHDKQNQQNQPATNASIELLRQLLQQYCPELLNVEEYLTSIIFEKSLLEKVLNKILAEVKATGKAKIILLPLLVKTETGDFASDATRYVGLLIKINTLGQIVTVLYLDPNNKPMSIALQTYLKLYISTTVQIKTVFDANGCPQFIQSILRQTTTTNEQPAQTMIIPANTATVPGKNTASHTKQPKNKSKNNLDNIDAQLTNEPENEDGEDEEGVQTKQVKKTPFVLKPERIDTRYQCEHQKPKYKFEKKPKNQVSISGGDLLQDEIKSEYLFGQAVDNMAQDYLFYLEQDIDLSKDDRMLKQAHEKYLNSPPYKKAQGNRYYNEYLKAENKDSGSPEEVIAYYKNNKSDKRALEYLPIFFKSGYYKRARGYEVFKDLKKQHGNVGDERILELVATEKKVFLKEYLKLRKSNKERFKQFNKVRLYQKT